MIKQTFSKTKKNQRSSLNIKPKLYSFTPCKLQGTVYVPPSKSYLHRYLLAATLAQAPLTLHHVSVLAGDIKVTLEVLSHFALDFIYDEIQQTLKLFRASRELAPAITINMQESGTSLRLFLPLLIHFFDYIEIAGENQLPHRPLEPYIQVFTQARFTKSAKTNLPLQITGKIVAQAYTFKEQMSSQFISGLLFALPLLETGSTIELTQPPLSLPYIQMTLAVLKQFQINIQHNETYTYFTIPAPQRYIPPQNQAIAIEPDYSARAFWEIARSIKHHDIVIKPEPQMSLQGDARLHDIIAQQEIIIDLSSIPDLGPILALYFSQTTGGTLVNVDVLIHKESNRLLAIIDFLTQAGISFEHTGNTLVINTGTIQANTYATYNDHRIAMMLIIAASLANGPVILNELMSTHKSYPTFMLDYQNLGGIIHEQ